MCTNVFRNRVYLKVISIILVLINVYLKGSGVFVKRTDLNIQHREDRADIKTLGGPEQMSGKVSAQWNLGI